MPLTLQLQSDTSVPLEVEGIVPSRVASLSIAEIEQLEMFHGNCSIPLGEFFSVSGDPTDLEIRFQGDCSGVHWIGTKMDAGRIVIEGNGGRHIGSEMTQGEIIVQGNAGDWVGGELQGGPIRVHGNAGHLVGAAYRGSRRGMAGGTILIDGDVGNELGHTMRRGLIAVGGNTGDLIGFNMRAGTILVFGEAGIRHGAGMRRGTIGLLGEKVSELLLSFRHGCKYQPLAIAMILQQLEKLGFPIPDRIRQANLRIHHGDLIEGGRGEIFTCA